MVLCAVEEDDLHDDGDDNVNDTELSKEDETP
jgi:hypothetical protein